MALTNVLYDKKEPYKAHGRWMTVQQAVVVHLIKK